MRSRQVGAVISDCACDVPSLDVEGAMTTRAPLSVRAGRRGNRRRRRSPAVGRDVRHRGRRVRPL